MLQMASSTKMVNMATTTDRSPIQVRTMREHEFAVSWRASGSKLHYQNNYTLAGC